MQIIPLKSDKQLFILKCLDYHSVNSEFLHSVKIVQQFYM